MHGLLNIVFNDEGAKIIMKCSSIDPHEDFDIFIIEGHIKEFLIGTSFCTTVDCFLMKIGTLFGRIEDDFGLEKSEKVVSKVLKCDEVREALRPLRNYIAPAEKMIMEDPRHARLQRYLPLLIPNIMELAPIKMRLEMKREPLSQLEGKRVGEFFPTPVKVYSSNEEEAKRKKKRGIFQASESSVPVEIEQVSSDTKEKSEIPVYIEEPSRKVARPKSRKKKILVATLILILLFTVFLYSSGFMHGFLSHLNTTAISMSNTTPTSTQESSQYYGVIADNITLETIRNIVYSGTIPNTVAESVTVLSMWVSKNIVYGDNPISFNINIDCNSKTSEYICLNSGIVVFPALKPEYTLLYRKGVCIDQAVFIATALISANVTPTYVLILEDLNHAVAGVVVNNTFFILDQTLPPIEYSDYFEYFVGNNKSKIIVFELGMNQKGVGYRESEIPKVNMESYKDDHLPSSFSYDVASAIAKDMGLVVSQQAEIKDKISIVIPPSKIVTNRLTNDTVKFTIFYHPLFQDWWVKYYEETILKDLDVKSYKYVWAEVSQGDNLTVYFT